MVPFSWYQMNLQVVNKQWERSHTPINNHIISPCQESFISGTTSLTCEIRIHVQQAVSTVTEDGEYCGSKKYLLVHIIY